jgi:hypothetical protein
MTLLLPPHWRGFMEAVYGLLFIASLVALGWHLPLHG